VRRPARSEGYGPRVHPLLKHVVLGVAVAAIAFPVLAYADEDSALRGPQLF
jgi:uncharacterized membrane protein